MPVNWVNPANNWQVEVSRLTRPWEDSRTACSITRFTSVESGVWPMQISTK